MERTHESSAPEVGRIVVTVLHKPTLLIASSQETLGVRIPLVVPGGWDEVAGGGCGCASDCKWMGPPDGPHNCTREDGQRRTDHGLYAAESRMQEMIRGRGVADHGIVGYSFACGGNCRVGTKTIQEVPGQRDQR